MFALGSRFSRHGLTLTMALSFSLLATVGHAYSPEEQQACTDDAFRVCGAEIPDVDRVTACMVRNRTQLSPDCRVYFRDSEPPPQAMRRKPVRKAPKAKKSKAGK